MTSKHGPADAAARRKNYILLGIAAVLLIGAGVLYMTLSDTSPPAQEVQPAIERANAIQQAMQEQAAKQPTPPPQPETPRAPRGAAPTGR